MFDGYLHQFHEQNFLLCSSFDEVIRAFRNYGILGDTHGYYAQYSI